MGMFGEILKTLGNKKPPVHPLSKNPNIDTEMKKKGWVKVGDKWVQKGDVKGITTQTTPQNKKPYRHPRWEENKVKYPKTYQELLSGTGLASQKWNVPQELLMDTSLIESGGRPIPQHGNIPNGGQGYFQFEPPTLRGLGRTNVDPYSATQSADLAAELMSKGQLSRWGTPGGSWGSLDATRRNFADRLTTYYKPQELNKFLAPQYQLR